jgi:hypothetical protein
MLSLTFHKKLWQKKFAYLFLVLNFKRFVGIGTYGDYFVGGVTAEVYRPDCSKAS